MLIYDELSIAFMQRSTQMVHEILKELKIKVTGEKFHYAGRICPIIVVVHEGGSLGSFHQDYVQISLNKKLIHTAKDSVVRDILRHELAHLLTYLRHGGKVESHGKEFRKICEECGFSKDVASATMDVNSSNDDKEGDLASEKIIEKVKKLFRLAGSSNSHEAELATVKANELLLRHNIEMISEKKETIYLDRLLLQKRRTPKLTAIYHILSNFVVRTVISNGSSSCCIDVSGTKANVMLARYVAEFLDRELDRMWEETKKESGLSGLRSKNSFYAGVASGFTAKMKKSKLDMSESDQKSLVLVNTDLMEQTKVIYKRLTTTRSAAMEDYAASAIGQKKGNELSINQGLEAGGNKTLMIG